MGLGGPVLLILTVILGALLLYKYATKEKKEANYASYFVEDEDYDNSEYL